MSLFNFCKIKKRGFSLFSSRKMVRQRSRKTVEELYTAVPPTPSLAITRFDENFFQNSKNKYNKPSERAELSNINSSACRGKSRGPRATLGGAEKKDEKTLMNAEKFLTKGPDECKSFVVTNLDNKNIMSYVEETEKDEDTEEFFELVKQTVENAVGKTLTEILNRNFREISSKMDELREQLRSNEEKLQKIQTEMNNSKQQLIDFFKKDPPNREIAHKTLETLPEIVHYGEENSRHFRYLCMKSEYDKMFYQHQNMMASMPVDARPNIVSPYPQQFTPPAQMVSQPVQQPSPQQQQFQGSAAHCSPKTSKPTTLPRPSVQCHCHNSGAGDSNSNDNSKTSMSTQSSEMGLKEVKDLLSQLQKFYENQQAHEKKTRKEVNNDVTLNIDDDSCDNDGEDDSSDDMSTPSVEEKLGAS